MSKIIIGNWKMNPVTKNEAKKIFSKVSLFARKLKKTKVVLCPPFPFLSDGVAVASGSSVSLGAQNCSSQKEGAYTGEVSASQLKSVGAKYVILGHSERRSMGEDDGAVSEKIKQALKVGLKIILCIGEKERDTEGLYLNELRIQINGSLVGLKKQDMKSVIVAYEPVWSIGAKAKRVATWQEVSHIYIFIKKVLSENFDRTVGEKMKILYGGSAGSKNGQEFLGENRADGLLVGRASLDPQEFNKILKIADES